MLAFDGDQLAGGGGGGGGGGGEQPCARRLKNYAPWHLIGIETAAITTFYRERGRRMNIANLPDSDRDAERIFDDYEAHNVRYRAACRALMKSTKKVMAELQDREVSTNAELVRRPCGGVTQGSELSGGKIGGTELVAAEQIDVVIPAWR